MNNEQNSFNLIDEPWIPVLTRDGANKLVSLGEVFADESGDIADLALNPYERVSVFRLLLCIVQAALGPERLKDEAAWLGIKNEIGHAALEYLGKWHDRFFLYGPHAFLQVNCLIQGGKIPYVSRLMLQSAHHFGSPLFSRDIDTTGSVSLPDRDLSIALLSYLNFSASGGTPTCKWKGIATSQVGAAAAPSRGQSKLFALLLGNSLLNSIWMNLLTNRQLHSLRINLGRPCWEFLFDNCETIERDSENWLGPINVPSRTVTSPTWLGTLTPLSRFIKLENGRTECLICEGFKYPQAPFWREPQTSFYGTKTKDGSLEVRCIRVNREREPWRDLSSILELGISNGGAIALEHLDTLILADPSIDSFSLWTGGMVSDADQDKDMNTGEWNVRLSVELLEDSAICKYKAAIAAADRQNIALYFACKQYALFVKMFDPTKPIKKQKENELVSSYSIPAERAYWDILAQAENQRLVQAVSSPTYFDDWKNASFEAAKKAYERACPAVTARQMEAFAQGYAKLTVK